MTLNKNIGIWWLSESDCKAIAKIDEDESLPKFLPRYLKTEFEGRYGRAGRCRLWVAKKFGVVSVDPWPDSVVSRHLNAKCCGGIVFSLKDYKKINKLPGIKTDFRLKEILDEK